MGKGRRRAHIISRVVMDIAAFKVSRSGDIDATALQAARARSSFIGRWMKAHGQFKRRAHIVSLIGVHVAVDQRCVAVDGKSSSAPLPAHEHT